MKYRNYQNGFSLIELMVVVAIIGILGFVAYPNYEEFVKDGKRKAAQGFMMELANLQANYLQDNRDYTTLISDLNATPAPEITDNYTVTIATTTSPPGYLITATPKGGMAGDVTLELNHLGVKTPDDKW